MTNNDFFRFFLHYTGLGREKEQLIEIFKLGGIQATQSKIKGWRTELSNPRASRMPDDVLQGFMQGMFIYRDKKIDDGFDMFNI